MKKLICVLMLIQGGLLMAQTETVVSNNGKKIQINPNSLNAADNGLKISGKKVQLGGTLLHATDLVTTPAATLAITGLQTGANTDKIVVGDANEVVKWVDPTTFVQANQVNADWNQTVDTDASFIKNKPIIPVIPNIVPSDIGTVIAINGKLLVAQEITVQMGANFVNNTVSTTNPTIVPIGNISNVIIDNKSKYTSSTTSNRFTVEEDGTYLISINVQASTTGNSSGTTNQPIVIGIVDNTTGKWVARVNDAYMNVGKLQTYTLIASIDMLASNSYSFACAENYTTTLYTKGTTGQAPASFFSVKRLK